MDLRNLKRVKKSSLEAVSAGTENFTLTVNEYKEFAVKSEGAREVWFPNSQPK